MPTSDGPTAEPQADASGRVGSGLGAITISTVVAGGIGYLILALVAKFVTDPARYLEFASFWSGMYLLVGSLGGLQQEIARASTPASPNQPGGTAGGLGRLALASGLGVAALVGLSSPLWARSVFAEPQAPLVAALIVALVGYVGIAVLAGVLYGLKLWSVIAVLTITDGVLRLGLVVAALLIGHDLRMLAWAVALPFPLTLTMALVWLVFGGRVRGRYRLDVGPAVLASNAAKAVGGAVALGVLTSGLPLLLGLAPTSESKAAVGALTFVVILTRAPLVSPLLALQSWLIVSFRDRSQAAPRSLMFVEVGVLGVSALVAVVAFLVEPWLLQALWGGRYQVDGATCAGVVFTAGLTAGLCVSGPATLASGRHSAYVFGWAAAAALTVGILFVPLPLPLPLAARALLALAVGPLVGIAVHVVAMTRGAKS
jgi:hypothetical protein